MPRVVERAHIDRPPEEVHAFLQELERYPEWIAFTDEVTSVDRAEGVVGTRYTEAGTGGESSWEIVAYEEGKREVHEGDIGIAEVRIEMTMTAADGGTDYEHVVEYETTVPVLGWLVDKLVLDRSMRDGLGQSVADLERILEQEG